MTRAAVVVFLSAKNIPLPTKSWMHHGRTNQDTFPYTGKFDQHKGTYLFLQNRL